MVFSWNRQAQDHASLVSAFVQSMVSGSVFMTMVIY